MEGQGGPRRVREGQGVSEGPGRARQIQARPQRTRGAMDIQRGQGSQSHGFRASGLP